MVGCSWSVQYHRRWPVQVLARWSLHHWLPSHVQPSRSRAPRLRSGLRLWWWIALVCPSVCQPVWESHLPRLSWDPSQEVQPSSSVPSKWYPTQGPCPSWRPRGITRCKLHLLSLILRILNTLESFNENVRIRTGEKSYICKCFLKDLYMLST